MTSWGDHTAAKAPSHGCKLVVTKAQTPSRTAAKNPGPPAVSESSAGELARRRWGQPGGFGQKGTHREHRIQPQVA